MGLTSEKHTKPQKPKPTGPNSLVHNCSHECAYDCAQCDTVHRTYMIILRLKLRPIVIVLLDRSQWSRHRFACTVHGQKLTHKILLLLLLFYQINIMNALRCKMPMAKNTWWNGICSMSGDDKGLVYELLLFKYTE